MTGGTRDRHEAAPALRRGRDGKLYRARPLTREQRNRARWAVHGLVCRDGLTIRAAQQALAEQGLRRSLGSLSADLLDFSCAVCGSLNT